MSPQKAATCWILSALAVGLAWGIAIAGAGGGQKKPADSKPKPTQPTQPIGKPPATPGDLSRLSGIVDVTRSKVDEKLLGNMFGGIDKARQKMAEDSKGCLSCHQGIEEMHVGYPLGCVFCHGGNAKVSLPAGERKTKPYSAVYEETKKKAHVQPTQPIIRDRRVLPMDYDLPYQRFLNPSNMRLWDKVCGKCHVQIAKDFPRSLHATSAGHYHGGLYLNGVVPTKVPRYGVFAAEDNEHKDPLPKGAVRKIEQLPPIDPDKEDITDDKVIYKDVPRKECTACHIWSRGSASRGQMGGEGAYRADGCAACHIIYEENGLYQGKDPTIDKFEPGHPTFHRFTSQIPTFQCGHCHFRGARIGLSFRGYAQMAPGAPGGPTVPGTSPYQLHGGFYLKDEAVNPPDIHHKAGMHCIDCHTLTDVMGDGYMYGEKLWAVEIRCETCHGTPTQKATFFGTRGTLLRNLTMDKDGTVWLTSKVTQKRHRVKQAMDVVNPNHPDYNSNAVKAMTKDHLKEEGGLQCYSCHNAWAPMCFGCHYQWNGQFTQLDMIAGKRTKGRTQLNEFVYTNYRPYYIGWDSRGKVSPYTMGCNLMFTVQNDKGEILTDLKLPKTAAGLSGLGMNPRQPHTVTNKPRQCAECHRSSQALGMGGENFRVFRRYAFITSDRGLSVYDVGREQRKFLNQARVVANLPLPDARGIRVESNFVSAHAEWAYVADGQRGLVIVDVHDPTKPKVAATLELKGAKDVEVTGRYAFVACGTEGVKVVDIADRLKPRLVATMPTSDARVVKLGGIYAYVADGMGGLRIFDVADPTQPHYVGGTRLNDAAIPDDAHDVVVQFSFSRPDVVTGNRTPARLCAYVANGAQGLKVVDVTEPTKPLVIATLPVGAGSYAKGVDYVTMYELGSFGGKIPNYERDYIVMTTHQRVAPYYNGSVIGVDVTDPMQPRNVANRFQGRSTFNRVKVAPMFLAPFLYYYAFVCKENGNVTVVDITDRRAWDNAAIIGVGSARDVAFEEMPLDRWIDEEGRQLKDTSHEGAGPLTKEQIVRLMRSKIDYPWSWDKQKPKVTTPLAASPAEQKPSVTASDGTAQGPFLTKPTSNAPSSAAGKNGTGSSLTQKRTSASPPVREAPRRREGARRI